MKDYENNGADGPFCDDKASNMSSREIEEKRNREEKEYSERQDRIKRLNKEEEFDFPWRKRR